MSASRTNSLVLLCVAAQVTATVLVAPLCGGEPDATLTKSAESIAPAMRLGGSGTLPERALASPQQVPPVEDAKALSPNELIARGQYQRAVDLLIIQLREARVAGMESERAALHSNLGMAYNKLGRYAEAESSLEKAMQIWKALGQTQTGHYARTLNNLANVYLNQRRDGKAEELFKEALAIYRNAPSAAPANDGQGRENLTDIALVLSNLGLTDISLGRLSEAKQLFEESLEIQRANKETKNLPLALNNLGLAYKLEGRVDLAARMYAEAVQAWELNPGHGGSDIAVGYHNLAMAESALGQTTQAEAHFKRALTIVDAALPAEHPTRIAILTGYGELLKKIGRKREAKQFQSLARAMRTQHDHQNFQDLTVNVQQIAR